MDFDTYPGHWVSRWDIFTGNLVRWSLHETKRTDNDEQGTVSEF
jgi:hypothetical protein